MKDTPRSLFRSASRFFSGTLASRISGLARDMAMAWSFGTGPTLAAFFIAFRLAHLLRRLLGEGALQTAFTPHFERLKESQQASTFFIDLYGSLILTLLLLVGCGMGGLRIFMEYGNLSAGGSEVAHFSFMMLPSVLFICLFGLNAALLQCEKHFFLPSVSPVAFNLVWIAALPFLQGLSMRSAMEGLSLAICIACFAQWLITLPTTLNILKCMPGKQIALLSCRPFSAEVRALFSPLMLAITGVAATQINSALDMLFARYAAAEGPAYLWFATRLAQLPLALFGIALASALLPALARAAKESHFAHFKELFHAAIKQTTMLMLPLTASLIVLSPAGIRLLYGWGGFNTTSIAETSCCLVGYAVGLIPQALVLLVAPAFYSKGHFRMPAEATLFAMLMNSLLNYILVFGLHWGAFSIAVATGVSAWGNLAYLALKLKCLDGNPSTVAIRPAATDLETMGKSFWLALKDGLCISTPITLLATAIGLIVDYHSAATMPIVHFMLVAAPIGLLYGTQVLCYIQKNPTSQSPAVS